LIDRRYRLLHWIIARLNLAAATCILQSISCRYEGKTIKRLHGANCVESFGIWEVESASSFNA